MTDMEQRKAAKEFAEYWKDRGNEKSESQKFWISLLTEVYGVKDIKNFIYFEERVDKLMDGNTGWMDVTIPSTKVLIEQKSANIELDKKIKHGDIEINAFQQAWLYNASLNYDEKCRWIVTCNFKSFRIYDMNNRNSEPEEILLKDLPKEYYRLSFLVDSKNEHIKKEEEVSFKAGELVGKLYDAFSKQYRDLSNEQSQKDLNELCVRLVFCLYAEDAGLFGRKNVFHDYLSKYDDLVLMRENLIKLFRVLDTPLEKRDPYLEEELDQFPYVNGGLFSNENIEIPTFTTEIKETLLAKASDEFDWSEISPTIFGAVFESTLNPETRRSGGMHYTSIENIHKVIDPLFLDELREMLNEAESYKNEKTRSDKLVEFQNHLASLTFFDPACGSGNFLTETYLSLRRLENEALDVMGHGRMTLNLDGSSSTIKVSIQQFYGIEINDFAVKVAKTALWIAEAQMYFETKKIVSGLGKIEDFLPLETYDNIMEGNALRVNWNDVVSSNKCNYIMGNPPFVGARLMPQGGSQKKDLQDLFVDLESGLLQDLDYVCGWYAKASNYIQNTKIQAGFVSTNSICQGVQATILWDWLFKHYRIFINYCYQSFKWESEANDQAAVDCVIVGFGCESKKEKLIFSANQFKKVQKINQYLLEGDTIIIEPHKQAINGAKKMNSGNQPRDGGHYVIKEEEYKTIESTYPSVLKYVYPYIGAEEFINNKKRWCLWLKDAEPNDIKTINILRDKVKAVYEFRINSSAKTTNGYARVPQQFAQITQPLGTDYIIIPRHTTSNRRYVPLGFMKGNTISSDAVSIIANADLYDFGILTSNVHMAWMRTVCGRLGNEYRYSKEIVYNNFPWPSPTKEQKEKIERTAKLILDVRNKYANSSLADLYDVVAMPPELRKAHYLNDVAVWEAYGKKWNIKSESDCVEHLMKMYQELVAKE